MISARAVGEKVLDGRLVERAMEHRAALARRA